MPDTTRVTISLPADLLDRAEAKRLERGESRSELFRRALETLLENERHDAAVRRYVEGYVAEPETEYEVETAGDTGTEAFDTEESWE